MGYRNIKDLVVKPCIAEGGLPPYEKLTALVLRHFPASKWQKSHYAWYKHQIKTGSIPIPAQQHAGGDQEPEAADSDRDIEEAMEASISLERDLHAYLATRLHELEPGLVLVTDGDEHVTDVGRIDLLARDSGGNPVVIELKAGKAKDGALGQLQGYMGSLSTKGTRVRGLLVASAFDDRVIAAVKVASNVTLVKYAVSFSFHRVG